MSAKNRSPHTSTYRGKWVRVVLRDDTFVVGRFHERSDTHVILKVNSESRKILRKDLKQFIVLKGNPSQE